MPFFLLALVAAFSGTLYAADTALEPSPPARLKPELPLILSDLRVLQAAPGKLDALHARLRDHQIPLLEQHGVFTQAVFSPPGENPDQRVYLLTAAEGLQTMEEGWAGLREDPQWLEVVAETEEAGKLVTHEDYQRLVKTNWSPVFTPEKSANPRIFELRTYECPDPTKHAALLRRFHNHTMKLFAKHGMQNVVYWVPDERPESQQRLVYLLAHESEDAAKESFAAFRKDPDWLAAKEASEKAAGGFLTNKEGGVVSEFLVATEYSPLK
jgi:hypothetical protein